MKERFELVYYIVFMILGVGGLIAGISDITVGIAGGDNYFKYVGIAFLMTLTRFIYNGQHFWNPPFKKPNNFIIIAFAVVSLFVVLWINEILRYGF
ncbi:MAG: hypothetical protein NT02SARS_1241 [SAR86 cluster bacterium SAR86B]|uniref:Uncharacterized protein n=1 Tax=SAR86 cluster bacterium SAR86B TaxID=1123867 RepID=J5KA85_9GAMM|nr:MAG: hypothetical protein NT02SARS_1241 [SAR86 cluster bacterium SAR86B]